MTKNAVIVDTSKLTIKQMEKKLVNLVKEKIKIKYKFTIIGPTQFLKNS